MVCYGIFWSGQLKPENTTRRIMEKITFSIFQKKTWIKKNIYFRKTDSYSRPDKAGIIQISYKTAFIGTVLSVEKFIAVLKFESVLSDLENTL